MTVNHDPFHFSCDKYWACLEGVAELRTCGNGLAFIDDEREEYKLEQVILVSYWSILIT